MLAFLFGAVLMTLAAADVEVEEPAEELAEEPAEAPAEEPVEAFEETVEGNEDIGRGAVTDSELADSDEFDSMNAYNAYMEGLESMTATAEETPSVAN
ncbi:hypothetical protein ACHWQZ_G006238 [Mnemiopsis leidyi]